jgi:hypothetical protein
MKKIMIAVLAMVFMASIAFAEEQTAATPSNVATSVTNAVATAVSGTAATAKKYSKKAKQVKRTVEKSAVKDAATVTTTAKAVSEAVTKNAAEIAEKSKEAVDNTAGKIAPVETNIVIAESTKVIMPLETREATPGTKEISK